MQNDFIQEQNNTSVLSHGIEAVKCQLSYTGFINRNHDQQCGLCGGRFQSLVDG